MIVDNNIVVLTQMDIEILLFHTRSGYLNLVILVALYDIDRRGGGVCLHHPIVIEEIIEESR